MRKPEANDALDRLYAAPLEEFVALRKALATALRSTDPAAARLVASAAKPTRTAWALNQVARGDPARLAALVEMRDEAAKAQKRGDAARMLEASRAYRDALNAVVHAARTALESAGMDASASQVRRMAEMLQAAAAEQGTARAQLVEGRLVRDVAIEDPFAGLEPGPRRAHPPQEVEARARRKAEAELEAARRRVAALEDEARAARAEARQAENEAARAQAAAERSRAKASDVEDRLRRAKEALRGSS